MPYQVKTSMYYEDVLEWLQENVGELLWSRPIVEWKGRGWSMHITQQGARYIVRIDDYKLAVLAGLKLS